MAKTQSPSRHLLSGQNPETTHKDHMRSKHLQKWGIGRLPPVRPNKFSLLAANSALEPAQEEEDFDWWFSIEARGLTGASIRRLPLLFRSPVNQPAFGDVRKRAALWLRLFPGWRAGRPPGRGGWEPAVGAGPHAPAPRFLHS